MPEKVTVLRIMVDGMFCGSCEDRIINAVGALDGVTRVTASASRAEVSVYCDTRRVERKGITHAIESAGYQVRGEPSTEEAAESAAAPASPSASNPTPIFRFLGLLAIIGAAYLVIRFTVGLNFLPSVSQSMGYGLIFVVGLLTSLHCIAMCGGIALSQGIRKKATEPTEAPRSTALATRLGPSLRYNGGRVISYTVIGGVVGALGSVLGLSAALKGVMPVIAGAFMLFLGLRMLGIFPWLSRLSIRFPRIGGKRLAAATRNRGPFVIGLLSGLMPCGPLQTMQVYALGTGSLVAGAFSMFLFSLGTVPLLLGFGAISSLLSARFNRGMLKASGVLVMVLGMVMFARGMNLFGVDLPSIPAIQASTTAVARIENGYQVVRTTVESGDYHPLVVQAGIPVRWTVSASATDLNGCNNPLTVPEYGISTTMAPGDTLIEFTPTRSGTITYTCWMGMVSSTIQVVEDLATYTSAPSPTSSTAGCCSN